jgi:hypothetical protein
MKQLIFLFTLCCFTAVQSQNITNINFLNNQEALDASVDASVYVVIQPDNGDATIAEFSLNGNLLQQQVFPNDNPSFATVIAKEVSANNGKVFATAETYADPGGNLNRSESLFKMPSNLIVTSATDRLVAYNSVFAGLYNDSQFVYVLYSALESTATLSINNVNGTAGSLIPNPGNGSFSKTWLLKIDANDVTNIIQMVPIGDVNNLTFAKFNDVDGQSFLKQGIVQLLNGNIVIEYEDESINFGDYYLEIIDSSNLSVVHTFGPFNQDVSIADFNGGYALAYYNDREIEFLNSSFQIENETWERDLSKSPYKMEQFGEYLKVAGANGISPGSETTRMSYFGERLIESHKRGGMAVNIDFRNYFESFFTSETTTINIANHQGVAITLGGTNIPATAANVYNLVMYTTDESGPVDTLGITDTNPDFESVYQNTKLDPNDNTMLISGTYNESWVTLAAGVSIPANESAIPNSWKNDIQIPTGFKLDFGGNALMGTDPFAANGFNRFFTVKIIPNATGSYNNGNLETLDNMRVWVTHNSFTSALSVNDFDTDDFSVYPNPTNGIINIESSIIIDTIEIYSITGQKLGRYDAVSQIDLSSVAAGLYILRIYSSSGGSATKKILKR